MNKEIIIIKGKCEENIGNWNIGIRELNDYNQVTPQKLKEYLIEMETSIYIRNSKRNENGLLNK